MDGPVEEKERDAKTLVGGDGDCDSVTFRDDETLCGDEHDSIEAVGRG